MPSGCIALVAIVLCAYLPAMRAGFVWDDDLLVTANPAVLDPSGIRQIWLGSATPDYAPLTYSAFWLEWRLWRDRAAGYHLINILLHASAAVLLWRILRKLAIPGAWLAALMFGIHPVNVASVAWIAELKNTLSMVFYLPAILWYLDFEETDDRRPYALALLAGGCAMLSKSSTVVLPLVLLCCAWWRHGRIKKDHWVSIAPFLIAAAWVALVGIRYQGRLTQPASAHASLAFRVVRAGDAFWFYLWKALAPVHLCAIYPIWPIDARAPLSYMPAFFAAGCFFVFWSKRKSWGRGLLFFWVYFAISLLPVLGFANMTFMDQAYVTDWWEYLAIIGLVALVAAGLARMWNRSGRAGRLAVGSMTGVILLFLGERTWSEAAGYQSLETLCVRTLALNPDSWTALGDLASVRMSQGRLAEARSLYEAALRVKPNEPKLHLSLAQALQTLGEPDEALTHYQAALELHPQDAFVLNSLGLGFQSLRAFAEAEEEFREASRIWPGFFEAHYNLARTLQMDGKPGEAIPEYQETLRLRPVAAVHNNLGNALFATGRVDEAVSEYQAALRADPNDAHARNNLAHALLTKQQLLLQHL